MDLEKKNKSEEFNKLVVIHQGLLFFLLVISGNYIGNLFSCRIQRVFTDNVYGKHIIGFISLFFFIVLVDPNFKKINPLKTLLFSIPIYIYFLILSKAEAPIFLIILLLLILLVIVNAYYNYIEYKEENNEQLNKMEKSVYKYLLLIKKIIVGLIFLLTILGFLIYLGMKKVEYQGKFKLLSFIFGTKVCKNNSMGKNLDSNISQNKLTPGSIIYFLKKAFS